MRADTLFLMIVTVMGSIFAFVTLGLAVHMGTPLFVAAEVGIYVVMTGLLCAVLLMANRAFYLALPILPVFIVFFYGSFIPAIDFWGSTALGAAKGEISLLGIPLDYRYTAEYAQWYTRWYAHLAAMIILGLCSYSLEEKLKEKVSDWRDEW